MGLHRAGAREGIGKKSTRNLHLTSSKKNWGKVEVPGSPQRRTLMAFKLPWDWGRRE